MSIHDTRTVDDDENKAASGDGGGAVPITGPPSPPAPSEMLGLVFALFAVVFAFLSLVMNLIGLFDPRRFRGSAGQRKDRTGEGAAKRPRL